MLPLLPVQNFIMIYYTTIVLLLLKMSESNYITVTYYNITLWDIFKETHKKTYQSGKEEQLRKIIFHHNLQKINQHNQEYEMGMHTYTMGVNHFTDLTAEECFNLYTMKVSQNKPYTKDKKAHNIVTTLKNRDINQLPETVDWRSDNVVSRVKNQGHCGSCWAFASTGALETQWAKKTKKLVELSEQNLIDCSWNYGNHGCYGGWMENAYHYIIENNGIDTEQSYPYLGYTSFCHYNSSEKGATALKVVLTSDESELQAAVATIGSVAVAVEVTVNFFKYDHGVYDDDMCAENANHALLVVGYGVEEGKPYWLVKNSWGPSWGEEGYIKMARNKNLCGIADHGTYPEV